jgi:hypothetical protein
MVTANVKNTNFKGVDEMAEMNLGRFNLLFILGKWGVGFFFLTFH